MSLGIAGYGRFGRVLERAAAAIGAPVVAVYDPSPGVGETRSEGGAVMTSTLEALVGHPHVDGIVIATSHSTHRVVAEAAFASGKHVFCEKPLATTVEDAAAISQAARRSGKVLVVGHVMRLHPMAIDVHDAVAVGTVGAPTIVRAVRMDWLPRRGWWTSRDRAGGLAFSPGIHTLDLLNWWLGSPLDVVAYAARQTQMDVEYPDAAVAIIRYASGAIAQVGLSISAGYPGGSGTNEITMTCQRGTIHVDFSASPRLTVEPQQESGSTPPTPARHFTVDDDVLVASEIQNFVDVVERQFEPIVSTDDAILAVATCQAIEQSMTTGSAVSIERLLGESLS